MCGGSDCGGTAVRGAYEGVREAVPLPTKYERTDHDQFVTFAHCNKTPLRTFVNQRQNSRKAKGYLIIQRSRASITESLGLKYC